MAQFWNIGQHSMSILVCQSSDFTEDLSFSPKSISPTGGWVGGGEEKVSGVGLNDGAVRTIMSSRMKCDPSPRLNFCRGLVRKAHERTETRGG